MVIYPKIRHFNLALVNNVMILNQEKTSAKIIGAANELTDPELGLPNPDFECRTCGAKDVKTCEGKKMKEWLFCWLMSSWSSCFNCHFVFY